MKVEVGDLFVSLSFTLEVIGLREDLHKGLYVSYSIVKSPGTYWKDKIEHAYLEELLGYGYKLVRKPAERYKIV